MLDVHGLQSHDASAFKCSTLEQSCSLDTGVELLRFPSKRLLVTTKIAGIKTLWVEPIYLRYVANVRAAFFLVGPF